MAIHLSRSERQDAFGTTASRTEDSAYCTLRTREKKRGPPSYPLGTRLRPWTQDKFTLFMETVRAAGQFSSQLDFVASSLIGQARNGDIALTGEMTITIFIDCGPSAFLPEDLRHGLTTARRPSPRIVAVAVTLGHDAIVPARLRAHTVMAVVIVFSKS